MVADRSLPAERPVVNRHWAALDFETTSLDTATCGVVEVGLVVREKGWTHPEIDTYVQPDEPITPEAGLIHGLTPGDLVGAPRLDAVLLPILDGLEGRILVVHNLPFDWLILKRAAGDMCPPFYGIDTRVLAIAVLPGEHHGLRDVARRLGVRDLGEPHVAVSDCCVALQVALLLIEHGIRTGILPAGVTMERLWALQVETATGDHPAAARDRDLWLRLLGDDHGR